MHPCNSFNTRPLSACLQATLEAHLLDSARIGLLDRDDVAVGTELLTGTRQMPDLVNDVTTNGSYILIFPIEASQVTHLMNREAAIGQELGFTGKRSRSN